MDDRAHQYPNLTVVGSVGKSARPGSNNQGFEVVLERGAPVVSSYVYPHRLLHKSVLTLSLSAQIILFDPPDPRRLRYLTTGQPVAESKCSNLAGQDGYGIGSRREPAAGLDTILPLVSLCLSKICRALI
jgi:hypothetical protein